MNRLLPGEEEWCPHEPKCDSRVYCQVREQHIKSIGHDYRIFMNDPTLTFGEAWEELETKYYWDNCYSSEFNGAFGYSTQGFKSMTNSREERLTNFYEEWKAAH